MVSVLSFAWWAAKALAVKDGVSRFFNKQMALAVGVTVGVAVIIALFAWLVSEIRSGAVSEWKATAALSRYVASLEERRKQRVRDQATAAEREIASDTMRALTEHAVTLEREIAALKSNPVCYPATITKELRK
jgi:hypothetical protein